MGKIGTARKIGSVKLKSHGGLTPHRSPMTNGERRGVSPPWDFNSKAIHNVTGWIERFHNPFVRIFT